MSLPGIPTIRAARWLIVLSGLCAMQTALAEPIVIPEPPNHGIILEEDDLAMRQQLNDMIDKLLKTPNIEKQIAYTGKGRTLLCNVCHGKDGIAVRAGVPNLAGQNPSYLVDQFQRFGDGRRYDFAMAGLAKNFTDKEKVLLAIYYSRMAPETNQVTDSDKWQRGQGIFEKGCVTCHGKNGRGEKGYARLAGQKPDYVVKMLKEFAASTGRRSNVWMTIVSKALTDAEKEEVAYYVSTLQ